MRIALFQVPAEESRLWSVKGLQKLLSGCPAEVRAVDLAVFPECLPFWNGTPAIQDAEETLAVLGKGHPPLICGGYVRDEEGHRRNAAFLVIDGAVKARYFKRHPWGERIEPGDRFVRFDLPDGLAVVPLICADAGSIELRKESVRDMSELIECGAGPEVPLVVPSYGAGLTRPFWLEPLSTLARGTGAPVVICGFAGNPDHPPHDDDGVKVPWGHGGSGIVSPQGQVSHQHTAPGVVIVNTKKPGEVPALKPFTWLSQEPGATAVRRHTD